ncbi:MAG: LexA family protein [Saprospiraceae bacterium]
MESQKERTIVRIVRITDLSLDLPYFNSISAGFPSPADDFLEERLSLDKHIIKNPSSTFFVKIDGHSMTGAGIHDGDIIVVDRSLKPKVNQIIVAIIDGEFTVKRLIKIDTEYYLRAEHPDYSDIIINQSNGFKVWGVVTYTLHQTNLR